ncbi:MAG: family 78 glycoside hydrolase catalytic domain, partial [Alistipes sp.]|nr:family 78 glycoside hydrolase catalytic domain [Alistipes sp.]
MKKQFYACMAGWVMACMLLDCGSAAANPSEGVIRPTQLTCEYQQNPGVVDVAAPRLSWINEADAAIHGAAQSAWQIRVATTKELLENDQPDLWDSKRMKDNRSTLITYGGKALPSGTTCWWQVRVWDQKGKLSAWSEPACWTMGMLSPEDWKCKWIGAPWQDENSLEKSGQDTPPAAPLLRKSFQIQKEIASAHFFGTGLGYFELYLNGEKVSDDVLVPAQTNYSKRPGLQDHGIPVEDNFREYRVMYLGYDVTSLLHQGDNVVGAILGNGFFNAKIHWVMAYGSPRFFGQILVRYKDGSQEIIGSDESWKASKSAIVSDMVYAGEHYDARQEQKGWSTPGFKDAGWQPVALRQAPTGILVAQNTPTDRVMEVLPPVTIEKLSDGKYRVDFGQEISGWLHLHKVKGEAGQRIDIKYLSESPNGANSYTLRGEGEESYHTHFTWYVFRTVE